MKCSSCGFENPEKANYCCNCGSILFKSTTQEERKLASILFADLSGFTGLSHDLEPEEVAEIVTAYSGIINPIIIRNGGFILGYQGDSVIALFGIPKAAEDDPERSVKCANEILQAVPSINAKIFEITGKSFNIGIHAGINSGIIALSETRSPDKKEQTVLGDAVNIASRIMNLAQKNEIYVAEHVFRQTKHFAKYGIIEDFFVKGLKDKIRVCKFIGLKEKPSQKRLLMESDQCFVGRDESLGKLCQFVNNAPENKISALFITGDAGIGKTRLIMEFNKIHINMKRDLLVFSQCPPMGENFVNYTLVKILEKIFGIDKKDTVEDKKSKIMSKYTLSSMNRGLEGLRFIFYLMSIAPEKGLPIPEYLDPKSLKLEIYSAIQEILINLCSIKRVFLIIDDFHWIDRSSADFFIYLSETQKDIPLIMIFLSRMEKRGPHKDFSDVIQKNCFKNFFDIELQPLDYSQSREIFNFLVSDNSIDDELADRILIKAGGNPFFIEEMARHIIEQKNIEGKFFTSQNSVRTEFLPDSVISLIYSRIDSLESVQKKILRASSVIGRDLNETILAEVSGEDLLSVKNELSDLSDMQYLMKLNGVYSFKHPLIQEVAYKTITKKEKKWFHERTAISIEKLDESGQKNYHENLALHYFKSENWDKSFEHSILSAESDISKFQNEAALKFCEVAETCANRLNDKNKLIRTLLIKSRILSFTGNNKEALKWAKKCHKLTEKSKIPATTSACELLLSEIYSILGNYEKMNHFTTSALKFYKNNGDLDGQANCHILSGRLYYMKSDFRKSLSRYVKALNAYKITKNTRGIFRAYNLIGLIYYELSDLKNSLSYQLKASKILKKTGDRFDRTRVLTSIAFIYYKLHKYSKALDFYEQSLKIKNEIGDKQGLSFNLAHIGILYMYKNDYCGAQKYFEESLKILHSVGDLRSQSNVKFYLGMIFRIIGDINKAKKTLSEASNLSKKIGDCQCYSECLYSLGLIEWDRGKFNNAEKLFAEALKINKLVGDIFENGRILTSWSRMKLETGDISSSRKILRKALVYIKKADFPENNFVYHSIQLGLALKSGNYFLVKRNLKKAERYMKILGTDHYFAEFFQLSAQVLEFNGDMRKAEKSYIKTFQLFDKIGESLNCAKSYYLYGLFLKKQGENDEYTGKAKKIFKDLKIPFWIKALK